MEESTIRIILLIIGLFVIGWILYDGLKKSKQIPEVDISPSLDEAQEKPSDEATIEVPTEASEEPVQSEKPIFSPKKSSKIISIGISAPAGKSFSGYDLLQTLSSNNMHYGEMQIFHRYKDEAHEHAVFSLVSASEPGDFNLNEIGAFSCSGLILFMKTDDTDDPLAVFNDMLKTTEQLADDLGGIVEIKQGEPITEDAIQEIRQQLNDQDQGRRGT